MQFLLLYAYVDASCISILTCNNRIFIRVDLKNILDNL